MSAAILNSSGFSILSRPLASIVKPPVLRYSSIVLASSTRAELVITPFGPPRKPYSVDPGANSAR